MVGKRVRLRCDPPSSCDWLLFVPSIHRLALHVITVLSSFPNGRVVVSRISGIERVRPHAYYEPRQHYCRLSSSILAQGVSREPPCEDIRGVTRGQRDAGLYQGERRLLWKKQRFLRIDRCLRHRLHHVSLARILSRMAIAESLDIALHGRSS